MAGDAATLPLHDLQSNLSGAPQTAPVANFVPVPAALPKVSFSRLEEAPLEQVVQSVGMVWVATDATKFAEAQTQMNAEPIQPRAERAPKAPKILPSGPMVLVETGGQEKMIDKN